MFKELIKIAEEGYEQAYNIIEILKKENDKYKKQIKKMKKDEWASLAKN